jgi:hypothetical protein
MASETDLRHLSLSPRATVAINGRRSRARLVELPQPARRFGALSQHLPGPRVLHAHVPDALSLASVDGGVEPQSADGRTRAARRATAPNRRRTATFNVNSSVEIASST